MIPYSQEKALLVILLASAGTYILRAGGLLLAGWLPTGGRAGRVLEALPGTILISLVAPAFFSEGIIGFTGGVIVIGVAFKSKNIFAAMLSGMLFVALGRFLLG